MYFGSNSPCEAANTVKPGYGKSLNGKTCLTVRSLNVVTDVPPICSRILYSQFPTSHRLNRRCVRPSWSPSLRMWEDNAYRLQRIATFVLPWVSTFRQVFLKTIFATEGNAPATPAARPRDYHGPVNCQRAGPYSGFSWRLAWVSSRYTLAPSRSRHSPKHILHKVKYTIGEKRAAPNELVLEYDKLASCAAESNTLRL